MPFHRKHLGPTLLRVHCNDALAEQAEWLLGLLASFEGWARGLVDGVTIQVGWSVLTLRQEGEELAACEPDFRGDPFRDVRDDVTTTLAVLVRQTSVLSRLAIEGVAARFDEKVTLAKGALQEPNIYAERGEPKGRDSGWYVGREGEPKVIAEDDLETCWLYQLLHDRSSLLDVMSLPPGYRAVWDGDRLESIVDAEGQDVWPAQAEGP